MNFKLLQDNLNFLQDLKDLEDLKKKLELYEKFFKSYSKAHNISNFKELEREIIASLKILDFKDLSFAENAIDLGSGAGFPAVFLAIVLKANFTLFEPNPKKASFLSLIKSELELDNLSIIKEKIELHAPKFKARLITSRALMKIPQLITACKGFFDEDSLFVFYKGSSLQSELVGLKDYKIYEFDKRRYCLILGAKLC
ncbi:16S rRNA (guanine(527)-N(7))-methyltransferase RsmG [Campylobacter troglodytis]|uniref:16S rRNA (guanine(527)-N(7))-methyltransferase RsmG n=1 Tax=Campylobacter troglodytis TaxID=654363 RepID=UPI001FE2C603|nr:16S rRNA (guanine(527)-N(7))-methyltransferase RsmG [Campylobacter troglodytis]